MHQNHPEERTMTVVPMLTPNNAVADLFGDRREVETSVRGGVIYQPAGEAGEYSERACNPYKGCGHSCGYCYVPLMTKQPRPEFNAGAVPKPDFEQRLLVDARKLQAKGITDQVLLSFATDPYPPQHHLLTRRCLEILRDHGLAFCTLTKGGHRALRDLDLFRPERDAFASTLTSLDPVFSRKWERHAADPAERVDTLRRFHDAGIFTWVSLEPTLDVEASLAIVEATHEFVDLYKVGQANYLPMTKTTDWRSYTERMIELLNRLGARHYIKAKLQPHLPPGYDNPQRVAQHH
jgi:DNA repair photolyase